MGLVLKLSSVICHLVAYPVAITYPLAITCPYCAITCPYRAIRMGYYRCKNIYIFSLKKVAEMFGGFADFSYLCSVVQEWTAKGGKGHPM